MNIVKLLVAVALVAPAVAAAQSDREVALEVVAKGEVDAPATTISITASFTVRGETQEAADAAKSRKLAELNAALQRAGVATTTVAELTPAEKARQATDALLSGAAASGFTGNEETAGDFTASDARSVRVTSLAQAEAAKAALQKIDVTTSEFVSDLDDAAMLAAKRQAKAEALQRAREDAAAYASQLGLRVLRISRISEAGDGLLTPALQEQLQEAISKGPRAMMGMLASTPGTVRVETGITAEFVLGR